MFFCYTMYIIFIFSFKKTGDGKYVEKLGRIYTNIIIIIIYFRDGGRESGRETLIWQSYIGKLPPWLGLNPKPRYVLYQGINW